MLINMDVVVIVLDTMHVHNFRWMVNGVKMLLFLVWTITYHYRLTREKKYLSSCKKKICLSLHYNGANSFLYADNVKFQQFTEKSSEVNLYSLWLRNISKDISNNDIKKSHWINPLKPGVAFLYPLKMFSRGIKKQHRAVMG